MASHLVVGGSQDLIVTLYYEVLTGSPFDERTRERALQELPIVFFWILLCQYGFPNVAMYANESRGLPHIVVVSIIATGPIFVQFRYYKVFVGYGAFSYGHPSYVRLYVDGSPGFKTLRFVMEVLRDSVLVSLR